MKNGDEIDRFKYSVMVITALSTFVYLLYNYFQNKPVNENFYTLTLVIISSVIIYVTILISYIFFRGFANEIQNFYLDKIINKFIPLIYKNSFLITIVLLFYSTLFYYFLATYFNNQEINHDIIKLLCYIVVITIYFLHNILMVKTDCLELFIAKNDLKTPTNIIELNGDGYIKNKFGKFRNSSIKVFNRIRYNLYSLAQIYPRRFKFILRSFSSESFFCCIQHNLFIDHLFFYICNDYEFYDRRRSN